MPVVDDLEASFGLAFYHFLMACLCTLQLLHNLSNHVYKSMKLNLEMQSSHFFCNLFRNLALEYTLLTCGKISHSRLCELWA